MSKLGKSLKNRFLAMALAGAMVMTSVASSGMPVFAEESSDVEVAADVETQRETRDVSEELSTEKYVEVAEDEEVKREDSEENEAEERDNKKTETESETVVKKESTAAVSKAEDDKEILEDEEPETDSADDEESRADVDNKAVIYTVDSAALADGHTYAKWGLGETVEKDDATSATAFEGSKGIYKNADGDILYIDASVSVDVTTSSKGKFAPGDAHIQVRPGTKIYVPVTVENNEAKIILYQQYISSQDEVIYEEGTTAARSFALSGDGFVSAQCILGEKDGSFYRTELICSLTGDKESAVICIQIRGSSDQHLFRIVSGEEVRDDVYDDDYGNSEDLVKYNMEGFANAYGVTGGGIMKPATDNYHEVSNAAEFLEALSTVKKNGEPAVIEVTGDLNLGSIEIGAQNLETYKSIIGADAYQALWHPTLKDTGVSDLTLDGFNNLTIFSSEDEGSMIKHCNIVVKNSTNIIFRNFSFDELWEWDDGGTVEAEKATYEQGGYKRNDWDYLCIDNSSDGIWIDHCTFYKSYDGVIDIKNPKSGGKQHVTISWCKFEPKSAPDGNGNYPFYDAQIDAMEADIASDAPKSVYYRKLRAATTEKVTYKYIEYGKDEDGNPTETEKETQLSGEGYEVEDIITYTCGQKKTHLLGQGDTATNAVGIRATFANNSWVNCMDRLPRLRFGVAHEYNCVLDASELYTARINNSKAKSHLVSNGAISTMGGYVFLENCYIDGIVLPLNSGNGASERGYIGQTGSIYKLDGEDSELKVVNNSNSKSPDYQKEPLVLTKSEFEEQLPDNYGSYQLYDAADLKTDVIPYAGAGSVKMTAVQWTKTSYGVAGADENPDTKPSTENPGTEGSSNTETDEENSSDTEESSKIQESSDAEESSKTQESSDVEESSGTEGSSEDNGSDTVIKFGLLMGDLGGNLTADYSKNGFTIKVQTGTTLEFDTSGKKIEGISGMEGINSGGRLKLGNTGNKDNRSIHFTAEAAGKLAVYATSASSGSDRPLGLFKKDGTEVPDSEQIALGTGPKALWFEITEPGDYYIASKGGGINLYYIQFSNEEEKSDTEDSGSDVYAPEEVDAEWTTFSTPEGDSVYDAKEGTSNALKKYNQEGYAQAANVTGGGLLKEDSEYYKKVTNELEFIQALDEIRGDTEKPHVIEITKDLDLGNLYLNETYNINIAVRDGDYSSVIRAQVAEPLIHPTLIKTGVSYIKLHNFHNLTIFSKNGAMIKHAGIKIEGGTTNLIIRNIVFDELWEWDEVDSGRYKRNDWDYMTIEDNAEGVWIDHCTFYKAYDGIIDLKNDSKYNGYQRVTISWCEILPGSKDNTFFNEQMTWLEEHADETTWYKSLLNTNMKAPNADKKMTAQDIWYATYGHDKTHLLGAGDEASQDKAIRVTIANSYYKNARSRLPRLRFGKVHEYNCVLDAVELNDQYRLGNPHITGNGPASTCNGEMLIENCYVNGVRSPLRSGYGSPTGYIKAVDSIYRTDVKNNDTYTYIERPFEVTDIITDSGVKAKVTDEVRFRERLQYKDYVKYDASKLYEIVVPYAGAGKLDLTTVQWERTNYNGEESGGDDESNSVEGSSTEGSSTEGSSTEGSDIPEESETDASDSVSGKGLYIVGLEASYDYTGAKIIPDIEVWDYDIPGGKLLALGTDYTVTYKNNVKPGINTAELTVKGKGNYSGKDVSQRFSITQTPDLTDTYEVLKGAKIAKIDNVEYNGKAQYPAFELTLKGADAPIRFVQNTDANSKEPYMRENGNPLNVHVAVSNNVNKGTATILVTGWNDDAKQKTTTVKKTFKITAADISTAEVSVTKATYAVSGAVPASVKVEYGEGENKKTLKAGKDYTVKYAKNKTAGEGTVTITGKGNYTKKCAPVPYTIEKLDLSTLKVDAVTATIGGKPGKIKATINDGKGTALKATQYTLSVYKDKDCKEPYPGDGKFETEGETIYVIATAKEGSKDLIGSTPAAEFKVGIDISKAKVVSAENGKTVTKTYTGNAIELTGGDLTVTLKVKGESQPRTLVIGQDYQIATHLNNINKGSATVVIKGIGSYSGTKSVKFKITQKPVENLRKLEEMAKTIKALINSFNE